MSDIWKAFCNGYSKGEMMGRRMKELEQRLADLEAKANTYFYWDYRRPHPIPRSRGMPIKTIIDLILAELNVSVETISELPEKTVLKKKPKKKCSSP